MNHMHKSLQPTGSCTGVLDEAKFRYSNLPSIPDILGIDHVAMAVKDECQLSLIEREFTGRVLMSLTNWPPPQSDLKKVPNGERKYMISVDIGEYFLVGVAPSSQGDQISKFVGDSDKPLLHHLAVSVKNIDDACVCLANNVNYKQLGPVNWFVNRLAQVFFQKNDGEIIELVWRADPDEKELIDGNIALLSASLRTS